jgi:hypothetical protein
MKRLAEAYVTTAVVVFNLLVSMVALNIMAIGVSFVRASLRTANPVVQRYGDERLAKVYPGKTPQEINDLLDEIWPRPLIHETFTEFKERPFRGRYVNVAAAGFRFSAHQGSWPPDPRAFNVFVFGTSRTFGYGVADSETVPSRLQEELRRRSGQPITIYNFGRGFYYSTQERILFEKLLAEGQRPQLVIFIDGGTEFYYPVDPDFNSGFDRFVATDGTPQTTATEALLNLAARLPIVHVTQKIVARLFPETEPPVTQAPQGEHAEAEARAMLDRYLDNKKMIEAVAAAYNVNVAFVWEPVPMVGYDLKSHLFAPQVYEPVTAIGYGLLGNFSADNFLRCDGLQQDRHEPLYVDNVHYTAAFSKEVASCIADQLMAKRLLTQVDRASVARGPKAARQSSTRPIKDSD